MELKYQPERKHNICKRKLVLDTMKVFVNVLNPQVLQTVLQDSLSQCQHKKTITSKELQNLFKDTDTVKKEICDKICKDFIK